MSSNIAIVPNPVITEYIDPFNKRIPIKEIKAVDPDEMYNTQVSSGTLPPAYLPSNETRGFLMNYIDASSECVPNDSAKKMYYTSLDQEEKHWIPLDYILFTRSDETQFLLAENISDKPVFDGVKSYSLLRYSNFSGRFNESTIFSDGIDIARIRSGDQVYIDAISDRLLSEKRINEALLSVDAASRYEGSDEITHASGYVGYVNANTLDIESTLEGNKPRILEKYIKENQLIIRDETPIDAIVYALRSLAYRFKQLFKSKEASWGGVIEQGTSIPEDKLKGLLRELPIEEVMDLDKEENAETIELERGPELDNEVANNQEKTNMQKAKDAIRARGAVTDLKTIAAIAKKKPRDMFISPADRLNSNKSRDENSKDEIGDN